MIDRLTGFKGVRAGRAFALLAALFVLTFGIMVVLIAIDQQRVLDSTTRLQEQTVPEIIRFQRLARNLEQLRQEGERVFAAITPQARQQAMFVVTLVASHPSVLEHRESAELARQTERFLADVVRQSVRDDKALASSFEEWQRMAARLGLLVDDVSIQGINLASNDLGDVSAAMNLARIKLSVALLVVGVFLVLFLVLLRAHLIHPLQRIDQALSTLSVDQPLPAFKPAAMVEIQAVEEAIGELHDSLVRNEQARLALESLANKDGLTGLTNRRHFMQIADAELQRAQRYRRPVTVGMADLDFFKKVNDTYGHAAGDTVLRAFAGLALETLRQSDLICRYGGEEFAFVFPESTLDEAARLAERFRASCAEHDIRLADGQLVRVTLSMGLADASDCPLETALNQADAALYDAKQQGRNRVVAAASLPVGE
ncbi:MAG: GGDEF domain-containing protein [Azonexus sp.]|nr:GGDEF domain-containing protein [Azonexus sp.]